MSNQLVVLFFSSTAVKKTEDSLCEHEFQESINEGLLTVCDNLVFYFLK